MPTQELVWTDFGGSGSQAADFTGVAHDTGLMTVTATLIEDGVTGPGDLFSSAIDSGEVRTDGNYDGTSGGNSALELDNAGGTGNGSSPGGDSNTVSLRLDFDSNNTSLYGDGAQNVSFWISDIDQASWQDQINVKAYDINGNEVSVNIANLGANLTYNSTTGDITSTSGGNLSPTDAAGAVQIVIPGPIAYLVIDYDNLDTGDQRVEISNIDFETIPPDWPWCFVAGTMIATPRGDVPVESLKPGDLVLTQDNGPQPLRWIGKRTVNAKGDFAPICFAPGVLGNTETLKVSPAHRVLLTDARVELLFEQSEVLVAAKSLLDGDRVYRAEGGEVTYVHLLFDRHELVWANGAVSESFHPIDSSVAGVDRAARAELLALFPEICGGLPNYGPAARPTLSGAEAKVLVA